MKLRLSKSQRSKGVMSKSVLFSLAAQVDLTAQEAEYVKKYKMGREVLYNKDRINQRAELPSTVGGLVRDISAMSMNINVTVENLVSGRTIECKDINEILDAEATVKTACGNLKGLLEACAGFEGEEIIDY